MQIVSTKTRARDAALAEVEGLIGRAQREGRMLTPAERGMVEGKMATARELSVSLEALDRERALAAALPAGGAGGGPAAHGGATLGEMFVASEAFRGLKDAIRPGVEWRGPVAELDGATLLGSGAGSGADLKLPDRRPGILPLLMRPLSVLDLFPVATTAAGSVAYMLETAFTNAAAARAEGAAAGESALTFSKVTEPVESIAHWLPVTEEMLDDVPALRAFIDGRLRTGLDLRTEDQVLQGNGTSPNLRGILNRAGIATMITRGTAPSVAGDTIIDAIARQISVLTDTNLIMPDAIVMAPALWAKISMLKDGQSRYLGDGPWAAQIPTLWGLPVVTSSLMTATDALVGAFRMGAQIFYRSSVAIEVSNSHSDYFTKMITAIRATRRVGLAVYRPSAFGVVRDA
jgi:HK97 family phage major capsid protein